MGKSQQRKGADGERELTEILRDYGYPVSRGKSQNYGTEPDIIGLPNIHIEVKRRERLRIYEAVEQSERDSKKFNDGLPAVFHRKNYGEWLVTMPLSAFMKVYEK